jgi:hypothetical protein
MIGGGKKKEKVVVAERAGKRREGRGKGGCSTLGLMPLP